MKSLKLNTLPKTSGADEFEKEDSDIAGTSVCTSCIYFALYNPFCRLK